MIEDDKSNVNINDSLSKLGELTGDHIHNMKKEIDKALEGYGDTSQKWHYKKRRN